MNSPRRLKRLRKAHPHMDSIHHKKQWQKLRRVMYPHNHRRKRSTKSKNPTSSSSPDFDDYILTEILHRLPWKSLSRSKCVSKRWCDLIQSPDFFRRRRSGKQQDQETVLGLFYQHRVGNGSYRLSAWEKLRVNFAPITSRLVSAVDEDEEEEMRMTGLSYLDTSLSFLPCKPVYIHGSQHGLILCSRSKFNVEFYVCNPITNQFFVVPEPETHIRCSRIGCFVDKASGQFKIVRIAILPRFFSQLDSRNMVIKVQVYSSVTNKWRLINSKLPHNLEHYLFVNNSTQAVQMGESLCWLDRGGAVVAFDVGEEQLRLMRVPEAFFWRGRPTYGCLGAPGDVLRYVSTDGIWSITVRELQWDGTWVRVQMEEIHTLLRRLCPYTRGWNLMNKNGKGLMNKYGEKYSNHLIPIGFHNSDPDLVFFYISGRIFSHHFGTRKVELLTSFDLDLGLKARSVFPYVLPKVPILGF